MKARVCVVAALVISAAARLLDGYTLPSYSYEQLFGSSDFVMIAEPVAAPRDTGERSVLRNVSPPVPVVGLSTQFKTLFVLKGPKRHRFTLHHFREPPRNLKRNEVELGGPTLLEIEPPKRDSHGIPIAPKRYLMFLIRERDGRFAPVAGQQDVQDISVQELSGTTVDD